jgi:hypothetical protein
VVDRYRLTETAPPVNARYWGLTQITAHDMVSFYKGMLSGSGGLSAGDRDFIIGQLRQSTSRGTDGVYQWFGLHDGLPGEPVLGIKQGWMCCFSDGYIWRHSTGIVGPDSRYVVVVLARDPGSLGSAHTVTSVTRAVQKAFPAGLIPRVQGAIGNLWYAMGGHRSRLGLPTTGEIALPGGALNWFERGAIYWSPATGAHAVWGAVLSAWGAQGYERGSLGYPISDPHPVPGGTRVDFQHGSLTLTSDGRVVPGGGVATLSTPPSRPATIAPAVPSTATSVPSTASVPSATPTPADTATATATTSGGTSGTMATTPTTSSAPVSTGPASGSEGTQTP